MNPKNTWLWIAVAAGLFVLVVIHQRQTSTTGTGPVRVLPSLKTSAVTSIQVRPGARASIRAERTNGVWQLTEPFGYPAQAVSIESLLASLERLTPAPYISARELRQRPKVDEQYGFVTPQASIIIEQPDYPVHLLVGAMTAPGDQVFLQVVGADGVYVVSADFLKYIPRSPEDWRDTTLIDLKGIAFDRLSVTNGAKIFELRRDTTNRLWRMVYPLQARAYSARADESLQLLQSVTVSQFIPDDPKTDPEVFGFQPPELEVAFGQGTNTVARLQFGKSPTNDSRLVYARRLGVNAIVAVPKDLLAPWYVRVNDFRDPFLLSSTTPAAVIEVRGVDAFSLQQQTNGTWRIQPQGFPVDAGLVKDFLSVLGALQVVEFTGDAAIAQEWPRFGLAPPARQYALKSAMTNTPAGPTNALIAEVSFGTNQADKDKVFVRRADEPGFVYAVKPADFERLPSASWQMRERRIWNLSTNDIASATIRQQGRSLQITRNGPHDWSVPGARGSINDLAVEETVSGLCQLTATAWIGHGAAERARYGFTDNSHQVTLGLKNGEKVSLELSGGTPSGLPYAAVTLDGEPWIFECPAWLFGYVQRFLSLPPNS